MGLGLLSKVLQEYSAGGGYANVQVTANKRVVLACRVAALERRRHMRLQWLPHGPLAFVLAPVEVAEYARPRERRGNFPERSLEEVGGQLAGGG